MNMREDPTRAHYATFGVNIHFNSSRLSAGTEQSLEFLRKVQPKRLLTVSELVWPIWPILPANPANLAD